MDRVVRIDNLLFPEECKDVIAKFLSSPMLKAERNGANYDRSVIFDRPLAEMLAQRCERFVPRHWNMIEFSDRFRFSRYDMGGEFGIHQDGIYQDPRTGRRSGYTLSIYLNDDYEGGETTFFDGRSMEEAK